MKNREILFIILFVALIVGIRYLPNNWFNGNSTSVKTEQNGEKTYTSNGVIQHNSDDPNSFGRNEGYNRYDCEFKLYSDRIIIDGSTLNISKIISDDGIFKRTKHVKVENAKGNSDEKNISNYPSFSSINIYANRCVEVLVEYKQNGIIDCIKTKHYRQLDNLNIYYWRKHTYTTKFKPTEEQNKNITW